MPLCVMHVCLAACHMLRMSQALQQQQGRTASGSSHSPGFSDTAVMPSAHLGW